MLVKKEAGNCKIKPALCFNIPAQGKRKKCTVLSMSPGSPETQRKTSGTSLETESVKGFCY